MRSDFTLKCTPPSHVLSLVSSLVMCLIAAVTPAEAQFEWNNWVFGDEAHVEFPIVNGVSGNAAPASQRASMNHLEGTSTWSNPSTGKLELYCDGISVFNSRGIALPGSIGHGNGISSTQAAQFVPHPVYPDSLFLFVSPDVTTIPLTNQRMYSCVKLGRMNGSQPWAIVGAPTYFAGDGTERLCAVHTPNGKELLVFGLQRPRTVVSWRIGANGLKAGVVTSNSGANASVLGAMKCSMDGKLLAYVDPDVIVSNIDPAAGTIYAKGIISKASIMAVLGERKLKTIYGLSFSPNARFLYITVDFDREPSASTREYDLLQFDLQQATWPEVATSVKSVARFRNTSFWPPALQLGPDSVIYMVSRDGLHAIKQPDLPAPACQFTLNVMNYQPAIGKSGLSSCIESTWRVKNELSPIHLTSSDVCEGNPIYVDAHLSDPYEDTVWTSPQLFSGELHGGVQRMFAAPAPGTYTIYIRGRQGQDSVSDSVVVTVYARPVIVGATSSEICSGDSTIITIANAEAVSFLDNTDVTKLTDSTYMARPVSSTRYQIATLNGACDDTLEYTIDVLQARVSDRIDKALCGSGAITLPSLSANGLWHGRQSTFADGDTVYVSSTERFVREDLSEKCPVFDTLVVTSFTSIVVDAGTDTVICEGDPLTLTTSGRGTVHWEPAALCQTPNAFQTRVSPQTTTVFVATVTENGCTGIDSVVVTVIPKSAVNISVGDESTSPGLLTPIHIVVTNGYAGLRCRLSLPTRRLHPETIDGATLDSLTIGADLSSVVFSLDSTKSFDTITVYTQTLLSPASSAEATISVLDEKACVQYNLDPGTILFESCAGVIRNVVYSKPATLVVHEVDGDLVLEALNPSNDNLLLQIFSAVGQLIATTEWTSPGAYTQRIPAVGHGLVIVRMTGRFTNETKRILIGNRASR